MCDKKLELIFKIITLFQSSQKARSGPSYYIPRQKKSYKVKMLFKVAQDLLVVNFD